MAFYIERFKDMETKKFDVEVVTPMFLGGADVDVAELRTPSLKGMLRFWWRVTCGDISQDEMIRKESAIFGSTETKSSISINIMPKVALSISKELRQRGSTFKVHGRDVHILDYLAYGTHTYIKKQGNVYHKEHITPGNLFTLRLKYQKKFEEDITRALTWLIHFGGIGSRSRNGFGSMRSNIEEPEINCSAGLKSFTANSSKTKLFKFSIKHTWHEALSEIGLSYRTARLSLDRSHYCYDRRKLIAAPITVSKVNKADLERHAKPYFLHVSKLDTGKYQGKILFIPYHYLSGSKDYSEKNNREYLDACETMNQKLKELSGGTR
jgi:CRISPR-associated protein Cmr1